MEILRVRNLTTDKLHTKMSDIYEDIEFFTGEKGIMTHMLPKAVKVLRPFLKEILDDDRYWDGKFDMTHTGNVYVQPLDEKQQAIFWANWSK